MKSIILIGGYIFLCFGLLFFSLTTLIRYHFTIAKTSINVSDNIVINVLVTPYPKPANYTPSQDIRIIALKKFFQEYKSPLSNYAEDIVKNADLWGIDYAIIPAISMQESGGCKKIPEGSYNCWGFGIYGTKITKFPGFKEAIEQVSKTVKEAYIKKGLTNATLVEDRWTPSSRGQWSYSVNYFIGKIREYERNIAGS